MVGYIVRRLLQALIVLLLVTVIVFILLHALPGGLIRAQLGAKASKFEVHQLTIQEGLTKPLPVQYGIWLSNLLHGNLGFAYKQETPVLTLIGETFPRTLVLAGSGLFLAALFAVPLGALQGSRRNSLMDYGVSGFLLTTYSTPYQLLGVLLIFVFAVQLNVLPGTATNFGQGFGTDVRVLALPVLALFLGNVAYFSRYVRSSVIDSFGEDYVRTARAKGASKMRILVRHVLRNSLLPFVSAVGLSLPTLVSGTLVIEVLFNYPGMGTYFWHAQQDRTYPLVLGILLVVTVLVVVGNLLADLAYAALDPRIRYD
ncbi:MAG TPA: ABC transporter permease [Acidimicrobiales bacterium]|nr:ABC transporter permease [Acidimicrobiales bacterium]